jgi:hypothetical protein
MYTVHTVTRTQPYSHAHPPPLTPPHVESHNQYGHTHILHIDRMGSRNTMYCGSMVYVTHSHTHTHTHTPIHAHTGRQIHTVHIVMRIDNELIRPYPQKEPVTHIHAECIGRVTLSYIVTPNDQGESRACKHNGRFTINAAIRTNTDVCRQIAHTPSNHGGHCI